MRLRYGINGNEPVSLAKAGRRLGVGAEQVSKLEAEALNRLATMRELEGLQEAA